MTQHGVIEEGNEISGLSCPACIQDRLHTQEELDTFHPNRIGVDDRDVRLHNRGSKDI